MKTSVIVFLLTISLLSPCSGNENNKENIKTEKIFFKSNPIMIERDKTIPAWQITIKAKFKKRQIQGIDLQFGTDRASIINLFEANFRVGLDPVKVMTLEPNKLIFVNAKAKKDLINFLNNKLNNNVSFINLAKINGPNGFPILLDLSGYKPTGCFYEKEKKINY